MTSYRKHVPRRSNGVIQILVEAGNAQVLTLDVTSNANVSDIVKRIPNSRCRGKRDVHVTFEGRVPIRRGEVEVCGIENGSTIFINHKVRGGGTHRNRKRSKQKMSNPEQQSGREGRRQEETEERAGGDNIVMDSEEQKEGEDQRAGGRESKAK